MSIYRDLSGNGNGVQIDPSIISISTAADFTMPNNVSRVRAGGAGNLILRAPGSTADITVPVAAGETIPVPAGAIIRSTSTATNLVGVDWPTNL